MATEVTTQAELDKRKRDSELKAAQTQADNVNKTRTGVGLRMFTGLTRGKGSQVVTWEAFDESKPESLPTSVQQFMDVTGKKEQKDLLDYLVAGFNSSQYTAASDPIAEYVENTWSDEVQGQFRIVVRNYAKLPGQSIESAVELLKPGFVASFGPK